MYYSEYGQDKWLEENVFKGLTGGVFFEAGALDGLLHSNSLFFEKERGWNGVLVEANPALIFPLRANRPTADVFGCALGAKKGAAEFEAVSGGLVGWSGLSESIEPQHRKRIDERIPQADRRVIKVKVRTLADILDEADVRFIDYLSLDLEGAELDVLRKFPFDVFTVDVIGVEDNFGNKALYDLLTQRGFEHLARVGQDEMWRRAN
jgi:FkbM family methyltransferase